MAVLILSPAALGQGIAQGLTADQNIIPTVDRTPGSMVNAGLSRAMSTLRDPLAPFSITGTPPQATPREQFVSDATLILATNVATALAFLLNRFLARAGIMLDTSTISIPALPPADATTTPPTNTGGRTGGRARNAKGGANHMQR